MFMAFGQMKRKYESNSPNSKNEISKDKEENLVALISEKMNEALNEQIGKELESAYIYLSMSMWLKEHSYNNLSNWFHIQAQEEFVHAEKFANYIIETGGSVKLPALPQPKNDWNDVKEIVEAAYAHEQYITGRIQDLVRLAEELREIPVKNVLNWFVEDGIANSVVVSGEIVPRSGIRLTVVFTAQSGKVSNHYFNLWENTGVNAA